MSGNGIQLSGPRGDGELLAAHVAGDPHAFEELFRRHRERLLRVARTACRNSEDAADALQDAMLKAHRSSSTFRHQCTVSTWLHRIVVNVCMDRLRRNNLQHCVIGDPDRYPIPDPTVRADTEIMVRRALMRLSVEQRAAVVAVDMHGYSIAEAAALLGVAEGTVKSRRARARIRLADLVGRGGVCDDVA